jgi:hypothetical protein
MTTYQVIHAVPCEDYAAQEVAYFNDRAEAIAFARTQHWTDQWVHEFFNDVRVCAFPVRY